MKVKCVPWWEREVPVGMADGDIVYVAGISSNRDGQLLQHMKQNSRCGLSMNRSAISWMQFNHTHTQSDTNRTKKMIIMHLLITLYKLNVPIMAMVYSRISKCGICSLQAISSNHWLCKCEKRSSHATTKYTNTAYTNTCMYADTHAYTYIERHKKTNMRKDMCNFVSRRLCVCVPIKVHVHVCYVILMIILCAIYIHQLLCTLCI